MCISAGANDEQENQEQGLEIEDCGLFDFCQLSSTENSRIGVPY